MFSSQGCIQKSLKLLQTCKLFNHLHLQPTCAQTLVTRSNEATQTSGKNEEQEDSIESMADYLNSNVDYAQKKPSTSASNVSNVSNAPIKQQTQAVEEDPYIKESRLFAQQTINMKEGHHRIMYSNYKKQQLLEKHALQKVEPPKIKIDYQDNEAMIRATNSKEKASSEAHRVYECQSKEDVASFFSDKPKKGKKIQTGVKNATFEAPKSDKIKAKSPSHLKRNENEDNMPRK